MCTRVVEEKALDNQGIYRVPGNSGALTAMIDELNKVIRQICYVQGNNGVLIGIIWESTASKNDVSSIFCCFSAQNYVISRQTLTFPGIAFIIQ